MPNYLNNLDPEIIRSQVSNPVNSTVEYMRPYLFDEFHRHLSWGRLRLAHSSPGLLTVEDGRQAFWMVLYQKRASGNDQLFVALHVVNMPDERAAIIIHEMAATLYPTQPAQLAAAMAEIVMSNYAATFKEVAPNEWPDRTNEIRNIRRVLSDD